MIIEYITFSKKIRINCNKSKNILHKDTEYYKNTKGYPENIKKFAAAKTVNQRNDNKPSNHLLIQ